jgi:flagellar hook protein FlgE
MSLFGAMTAGVAGLGAQGQAISVISDNLANTNTIGYKASRALFSQMVTSSGVSGTEYNSGGVGTSVLRSQSTQGSFTTSTSKTDLAISGTGFFVVSDSKVNSTQSTTYYTRAGSFSENKEGYLVNPDGFYLQGWRTESDGTIVNVQEPEAIELQSVGVSAKETQSFSIKANLQNTETVNTIYSTLGADTLPQVLQDTLDDPTLADYVADVRVYDAQGGARDMTIHFTKRAANTWDWQLVADSSDIQVGTGEATSADGSRVRVGGGVLEFNTSGGTLKYATGTDTSIQWANGVDASEIKFDFGQFTGGQVATIANTNTSGVMAVSAESGSLSTGVAYQLNINAGGDIELTDPTGPTILGTITAANVASTGTRELYFAAAGVRITVSDDFNEAAVGTTVDTFTVANQAKLEDGIGTDGMTQLDSAYNTGGVNQDGFGAGSLASISVDEEGFVSGTFTNGEVKKLYKVALAAFQNPSGLEVVSGSLLQSTDASGQALLKQAGLGGTGRIVSGSLEGSTTDIASEFSNMIIAQRAFQASSKVITTVDQMLNELLQLR